MFVALLHVTIPVDLERSEKLDCPRPRAPRGAAAEDHLFSVIEVFDQGCARSAFRSDGSEGFASPSWYFCDYPLKLFKWSILGLTRQKDLRVNGGEIY